MTTRVRFAAAADVFEAFPRLEHIVSRPGGAAAPLDYARELAASPRPVAALAFLAHLLPRRETVWWGCQCVATVMGEVAKDEAWQLAVRWVRDPAEPARRAALEYLSSNDARSPSYWLARAVGYSGGSILAEDQPPLAPAPDACATAVNAAIVLATAAQSPPLILPWMRACAEAGDRFAAGDDLRISPPNVT
jgi:hypothetical protein